LQCVTVCHSLSWASNHNASSFYVSAQGVLQCVALRCSMVQCVVVCSSSAVWCSGL